MSSFFDTLQPYAQRASLATGIPASVILGQWAIESAQGKSTIATKYFNYAGIKKVGSSIAAGVSSSGYAVYDNLDQFTEDYIRVMSLSYYDRVRAAGTVQATVAELAASPYAESGYNGGKGILQFIQEFSLEQYDRLREFNVQDMISGMDVDTLKNMAMIGVAAITLVSLISQNTQK